MDRRWAHQWGLHREPPSTYRLQACAARDERHVLARARTPPKHPSSASLPTTAMCTATSLSDRPHGIAGQHPRQEPRAPSGSAKCYGGLVQNLGAHGNAVATMDAPRGDTCAQDHRHAVCARDAGLSVVWADQLPGRQVVLPKQTAAQLRPRSRVGEGELAPAHTPPRCCLGRRPPTATGTWRAASTRRGASARSDTSIAVPLTDSRSCEVYHGSAPEAPPACRPNWARGARLPKGNCNTRRLGHGSRRGISK
jgi:hypothetical protein